MQSEAKCTQARIDLQTQLQSLRDQLKRLVTAITVDLAQIHLTVESAASLATGSLAVDVRALDQALKSQGTKMEVTCDTFLAKATVQAAITLEPPKETAAELHRQMKVILDKIARLQDAAVATAVAEGRFARDVGTTSQDGPVKADQ